jgi:HK97 family phage major capsid protein
MDVTAELAPLDRAVVELAKADRDGDKERIGAAITPGRANLVGTTESGMGATIAGLTVWQTPGVPAGTAIVADATQIVVVVREDASVAVSDQFAFNADGTVVRVIARVDVGVNDPDGLAVVKAGAGA